MIASVSTAPPRLVVEVTIDRGERRRTVAIRIFGA
jgi:hypothetical protein